MKKNITLLLVICGFLMFITSSCKKEVVGANVTIDSMQLTSADWKWNSSWGFTTSTGSSTYYFTRYVDISVPALTEDVINRGSVQVFFMPAPGLNTTNWTALPFQFLSTGSKFYYNIVYEYLAGKIRLHYFWTLNDPTYVNPNALATYAIPTYKYKYVIISKA